MIYFDNAATTKPSAAAQAAFMETFECFGNPSSQHFVGEAASNMMDKVRGQVAAAIGAQPSQIIFTSGGTEADNLALQGVCAARKESREIVISAVEHPAVYKTCRMLKKNGYRIKKISCNLDGNIDENELRSAVTEKTAIVSFMTVNNETGTVFPISRIAQIVKECNPETYVHTDAVQALGKIPLSVGELGVDLMTLSAHKIHGFKGAGALYVRDGVELFPVQFGGGQENGLRSGTEATPAICAFGAAAQEATERLSEFQVNVSAVKGFIAQELESVPGVCINSSLNSSPHILNFSTIDKDALEVLKGLSERGVCISKGAACKSNHQNGPSMLMSFGLDAHRADNALRLSFGIDNTLEEAQQFLELLREVL